MLLVLWLVCFRVAATEIVVPPDVLDRSHKDNHLLYSETATLRLLWDYQQQVQVMPLPTDVRHVVVLDMIHVDNRVHYGETVTVRQFNGYQQQVISDQPSQMYIILTHDLTNLLHVFKILSSAKFWNARARFLVVPDTDISNLESVLRQAWVTLYVLNLTVLLGTSAMTYHPFKGQSGSLITVTSEDLFPDKARDLHGHLLIGSVFPSPPVVLQRFDGSYAGPDIDIFLALAQYINATPRLLPPSDGHTYGFRTRDGLIGGSSGDVAYGRANITANSRFQKLNLSDHLEFSYPCIQDDYSVIVPKAGLVPMDRNLLLPFTWYTWIAVLCFIPGVAMCFYLLFHKSGVSRSLLNSLKAFLTGAMPPDTTTTPQRMFLIVWVFCSVVLTSAYQGSLTSYLVAPQSLPDIDTLQQLNSSRLTLLGFLGARLVLRSDTPIISSLADRFTPGDDTEEMLSRVALVKDAALLRGARVASYQVSRTKFTDENGHPLLHLMKQSLLMKYTIYEVTRGSPVLPHLNTVVQRVVEAGLYSKWTQDTEFEEILVGELRKPQQPPLTIRALQLKHLQCAFYILASGLTLATVAFFGEVCCLLKLCQLLDCRKANDSPV